MRKFSNEEHDEFAERLEILVKYGLDVFQYSFLEKTTLEGVKSVNIHSLVHEVFNNASYSAIITPNEYFYKNLLLLIKKYGLKIESLIDPVIEFTSKGTKLKDNSGNYIRLLLGLYCSADRLDLPEEDKLILKAQFFRYSEYLKAIYNPFEDKGYEYASTKKRRYVYLLSILAVIVYSELKYVRDFNKIKVLSDRIPDYINCLYKSGCSGSQLFLLLINFLCINGDADWELSHAERLRRTFITVENIKESFVKSVL